jgi:hypothetical protein
MRSLAILEAKEAMEIGAATEDGVPMDFLA